MDEAYWKIKRENAMLRSILDNIPEGVYATDENDIVVVHNIASEKQDGLPESEVLGLNGLEVFANTGWNEKISKKVRETGKPLLNTFFRQIHNGRVNDIIVDSFPFYYDNEFAGMYSICWTINIVNGISNLLQGVRTSLTNRSENKNDLTDEPFLLESIVGDSIGMQNAILQAKTVASKDSPVFIIGETGTGKELFAKGIHYASTYRHGSFIPINCAAIPESLMESIFFGTVKGAFTGAVDMPGLFEQAHKGTLFLDEINSMPKSMQSKLLRVLQEKRVRRIGSKKEIPVDCRIMSATNADPLVQKDAKGEEIIRPDLFFRLAVVTLNLPPLREHRDDIPLLCQSFFGKYNKRFNTIISSTSKELEDMLMNYFWPGNIRELENVIESGMNFVGLNDKVLDVAHIPRYIRDKLEKGKTKVSRQSNQYNGLKLREAMQAFERGVILEALENNHWNRTRAAEDLGILRQNLYHKMKEYNIEGTNSGISALQSKPHPKS